MTHDTAHLTQRRRAHIRKIERSVAIITVTMGAIGFLALLTMAFTTGVQMHNVILLISMCVLTELGVTIGYHRYFTHRSFKTRLPIQYLIGILGSMAAEGPVGFWVAAHRCHHHYSDHEGDPHSPHLAEGNGFTARLKGFWHGHVGWLFDHTMEDRSRYLRDLRRDKVVQFLNKQYMWLVLLGLAIPTLIGYLLTFTAYGALSGFIWGGLGRIFVVHNITWSVNSLSHLFGGRAYETTDKSRNNVLVGLLAMGEGWHNNHHAFPSSARHGLAWWQFDISYILIWTMKQLRLMWDIKLPSAEAKRLKSIKHKKNNVDLTPAAESDAAQ